MYPRNLYLRTEILYSVRLAEGVHFSSNPAIHLSWAFHSSTKISRKNGVRRVRLRLIFGADSATERTGLNCRYWYLVLEHVQRSTAPPMYNLFYHKHRQSPSSDACFVQLRQSQNQQPRSRATNNDDASSHHHHIGITMHLQHGRRHFICKR
jgi:hypothetical protein